MKKSGELGSRNYNWELLYGLINSQTTMDGGINKKLQNDAQCKDIIAKLVLDPDAQPPYQLVEGILKYKGKIYVGSSNDLWL